MLAMDIIQTVQRHVVQTNFKKSHPSGFFSPSVIVYFDCPMQFLFFKLIGTIEPFATDVQIKMDVGNVLHNYIQGLFSQSVQLGVVREIRNEVWLPKNNWLIRGKVDTEVTYVASDNSEQKFLIEIKTRDARKFAYLKKPLPGYIKQIHIYSFITNIHTAKALVFNNVDTFKEFDVPFKRTDHLAFILQSITQVLTAIKEQKLPCKICKTFKEKAAYNCKYKEICTQTHSLEQLIEEHKVPKKLLFTTWAEWEAGRC